MCPPLARARERELTTIVSNVFRVLYRTPNAPGNVESPLCRHETTRTMAISLSSFSTGYSRNGPGGPKRTVHLVTRNARIWEIRVIGLGRFVQSRAGQVVDAFVSYDSSRYNFRYENLVRGVVVSSKRFFGPLGRDQQRRRTVGPCVPYTRVPSATGQTVIESEMNT